MQNIKVDSTKCNHKEWQEYTMMHYMWLHLNKILIQELTMMNHIRLVLCNWRMCFIMETVPLDKPTPPSASFHGVQHGHVKEYIAANWRTR